MLPVVALVGRPNVGKSTLFNCLTRSRDALVAATPGLTRDRQYGVSRVGDRPFLLVDTGGLTDRDDPLAEQITTQVATAVSEADLVVFLVDARDGLMPADEQVAQRLRRAGSDVHLVVNKTDGLEESEALADFHALGLGEPLPIAASHNRGIGRLAETIARRLPRVPEETADEAPGTRVAVLGRPNVGKSTLVNRLLGEARMLAEDAPGTTRDSIRVPFSREGRDYVLIDTAGIRRRARVHEAIEKLSVIKAFQAMEAADVVVVMLDARDDITDQDARLVGNVLEAGRALVLAVNKWDGLEPDVRRRIKDRLDLKLGFVPYAEIVFISALHGTGMSELMAAVDGAYEAASRELGTNELTRILRDAVAAHAPPMVQGRTPKPRYAHSGGHNPPRIIVHGNRLDTLPESYRRYLTNCFRDALKLRGTPIKLIFRGGDNPYAGKKNPLTERQKQKRRRLMRHVKRKS